LNIPNSYLHSTHTNKYSKLEINQYLQEFNQLGDNKVIKTEGYRPIFIIEAPILYPEETIGRAYNLPAFCIIILEPDNIDIKQTLYHEYAHCLGFKHVDNPSSLMYYSLDSRLDERSIKFYANEIKGIYE
jgi:hypothetical protein